MNFDDRAWNIYSKRECFLKTSLEADNFRLYIENTTSFALFKLGLAVSELGTAIKESFKEAFTPRRKPKCNYTGINMCSFNRQGRCGKDGECLLDNHLDNSE